jgi:hypothetical protein
MGRLIRFLVGVVMLLAGGALLIRYGETAFLSLYGVHTDARVLAPCRAKTILVVPTAPRCPAAWGNSNQVDGNIVGADLDVGQVVPVQVKDGDAYLQPDSGDALLGYVSPVLIAVGFGVAVARRRRPDDGG